MRTGSDAALDDPSCVGAVTSRRFFAGAAPAVTSPGAL
jgi:hypothetical protein